ncbi:MAG: ATP-binding protein [Lachnospiraceae bacterium]|nr:ATP-binding protein [Lachnospiraceae bacterium]
MAQGEIPTTDKDGLDHGFGLATIEEAAKCLEGESFCYTEDGDFILNVMVSRRAFPNAF